MLTFLAMLWLRLFPRPAPVLYWKRLTGRDARGRFVSRAWTQSARTYSAADLAWFRSPIAEAK